MSTWAQLTPLLDGLQPHVVSVAVIASRLLPIAFLCPLLGGQLAPMQVKLGLVLSLAIFLHAAAGIEAPQTSSSWELVGVSLRELTLGTTLGLVAALPFDAARMGGRFADMFRGSSAEGALPMTGTKESATGDGLYQLLVALAATGAVMPLLLSAVFRSFVWTPLGTFSHSEAVTTEVARLVGGAFATGLALGAPLAGVSLAVDALLGLASRASPQMNLQETGAPLRILGGGAVLWLAIGALTDRLVTEALAAPEALQGLLELGR